MRKYSFTDGLGMGGECLMGGIGDMECGGGGQLHFSQRIKQISPQTDSMSSMSFLGGVDGNKSHLC